MKSPKTVRSRAQRTRLAPSPATDGATESVVNETAAVADQGGESAAVELPAGWQASPLVLMATLLAVGCSRCPILGQVTGTVRVNGSPLAGAYVVFTPVSRPGSYVSGYTNEDGVYQLRFSTKRPGAPVGIHRVSIRADQGNNLAHSNGKPAIRLPAKYNDETALEREVFEGDNLHDFDLDVAIGTGKARSTKKK
jgi:hypothetical protein